MLDVPTVPVERRYRVRKLDAQKTDPLGIRLWQLIAARTSGSIAGPLRRTDEIDDIVHARMVSYVVNLLVSNAKQIRRKYLKDAGLSERLREDVDRMVDDLLVLGIGDRNEIADLLLAITKRNAGGDPLQKWKHYIHAFAEAHGHRCYLCGINLTFDKWMDSEEPSLNKDAGAKHDHVRRMFELDHVFPTAKGGSWHPTNLAGCCNDCNKAKDHLMTYAETQVENVFALSNEEERVVAAFGRHQRVGILWRQRGRCSGCDRPFHDADDERLFLTRVEEDEPFHFLNARITCGACDDEANEKSKGFKLRDR